MLKTAFKYNVTYSLGDAIGMCVFETNELLHDTAEDKQLVAEFVSGRYHHQVIQNIHWERDYSK